MQEIDWALALAFDNAGNNIPARMAMIAITTKSSINVNAEQVADRTAALFADN